jgi:hypothetical protein
MEILWKIGRENWKANELGSQGLAAILSPLGLYGGNQKSKIPFSNNYGYKPLKGGFGSLQAFSIGRIPGDCTLRSLDASHAIPTRVLHFEDSRLRRRTPVRPVLLTGQTGTHRSDRFGTAAAPSSVLPSWLCGSTKEPSGFPVNHRKLRELGVASVNLHSLLSSHVVPARPWF